MIFVSLQIILADDRVQRERNVRGTQYGLEKLEMHTCM
jgi:hypothetical protein